MTDGRTRLAGRAIRGKPAHLRAVAYRMLGSLSEADDAVQEAWLRLSRSDTSGVENLGGWLTTVVARVCLDMLRSRKSRREESLGRAEYPTRSPGASRRDRPRARSAAGRLGRSRPARGARNAGPRRAARVRAARPVRLPFDEIAPIVGRSPTATRQLASRARRRVQGQRPPVPDADLTRQREVVDAFLAAARGGDFDALLAVLDPEVVLRSDRPALPSGALRETRGAAAVASRAMVGGARAAQPALVNGAVGVVVAPRGRLLMVLVFTIGGGKIVEIDAVADPERLQPP